MKAYLQNNAFSLKQRMANLCDVTLKNCTMTLSTEIGDGSPLRRPSSKLNVESVKGRATDKARENMPGSKACN